MKKTEKYFGSLFLKLLRLSMTPSELSEASFDPWIVKNILVVLRHRMGDTILAVPMLNALRQSFPEAHITLITKSSTNYRRIFENNDLYTNEVKEYEYGFDNFIQLIHGLRRLPYDLAIVPSTVSFSVTNHLIAYYSKAKYRVGVESFGSIENPCAFLLNIKSDFPWKAKKTHQIKRNFDVIGQLGINPGDTGIQIPLSSDLIAFARQFFKDNFPESFRMVVGLHPGAGKSENVWSMENFAELILNLKREFNPYFFISEGPLDSTHVQCLLALLKKEYSINGIVVHRGALLEGLALIGLLDLFITNDTGIMHLAASRGIPIVSLFGPTVASEWAPIGESRISIQSPSRNINDIKAEKVFEICVRLVRNYVKSYQNYS